MYKMNYPFSGIVIHGLQNGRKFGFPTANIDLAGGGEPIETGVYAVEVLVEDEKYRGMLYVGNRPTLHLSQRSIEINLFDFSSDIYGKVLKFKILKKIRGDIKFDSVEQLIARIKKDQDEILSYFNL